MRRFWKRRGEQGEWPEPRTEFLNSLADEIQGKQGRAPFRELRLALVVAALVALLVPLAAFAGRGQKDHARDTVKAVMAIFKADTTPARGVSQGGDDDDDDNGGGGGGGGGGDDDDDDNGGGDDDNGGYDEDECDDFGERRAALAHHQNAERNTLRQHQTTSLHPGLSSRQRAQHYKEERTALFFHQSGEKRQLKEDCPGGGDDDDDGGDDDDDDGGGDGDD